MQLTIVLEPAVEFELEEYNLLLDVTEHRLLTAEESKRLDALYDQLSRVLVATVAVRLDVEKRRSQKLSGVSAS